MIQIAVLGADGRMGQWVQKLLKTEFSSKATFTSDVLSANALIDFSSPTAVIDFITQAPSQPPVLIIGSTAWSPEQHSKLASFAKKTRIIQSSNFSIGFFSFIQNLKALAPDMIKNGYQIKIVETHHVHKKDSPSGSAVLIRDALKPLMPQKSRENIPIASHRVGEVIGEHEVIFEGLGDCIIFKHSAKDRSIFARGAIEAALWLSSQPKGPNENTGKVLNLEDFLSARP